MHLLTVTWIFLNTEIIFLLSLTLFLKHIEDILISFPITISTLTALFHCFPYCTLPIQQPHTVDRLYNKDTYG